MRNAATNRFVVAALACCASGAVVADQIPERCFLDTFDGLYIFASSGFNVVAGVAQPKAIVELIRFRGDGTLVVPAASRSVNGAIARSPPGGTGTYTMATDCTGTLAFDGGPSFDLFATSKGDDLWMIQNNPNTVLQGIVTRISR